MADCPEAHQHLLDNKLNVIKRAEGWQDLMAGLVQAGRCHILLQLGDAQGDHNSFDTREPVRHGKTLSCPVYDYPDKVKAAFSGKKRARITSWDPKTSKEFSARGVGAKRSSIPAAISNVSEVDELKAMVTLELQGRGKIHPENITIEPEDDVRPKDLEKYLALIDSYITGEGMPLLGRMFYQGRFPDFSDEGMHKRPDRDESQNTAYGMAMGYEQCPVVFLDGGPGSGKTTVISDIVEGHIEQGRKVLVLSHSNKGAQVPADMLRQRGVDIHIAGNDFEQIEPHLRKHRIKRNTAYPHERISRILNMSDGEIIEKHLKEEVKGRCLNDKERSRLIHDWKTEQVEEIKLKYAKKLEERKKKFEKAMEGGGVAFSTLGTLLNDQILEEMDFDVVILDEATRLNTGDLALALKNANKQFILVGDPRQLGNIPLTPQTQEEIEKILTRDNTYTVWGWRRMTESHFDEYARSIEHERACVLREVRSLLRDFFVGNHSSFGLHDASKAVTDYQKGPYASALLDRTKSPNQDLPYVFLDHNRRSLPNIVKVLSELVYDGKLMPGRLPQEGENEGIVRWMDTSGLESDESSSGTSKKNTVEANLIAQQVLDKLFKGNVEPEDIAVIATYKAQADAIKRRLLRRLWNNKELYERLEPNIATVDAFQGDEKKVVFVSMTRSNKEGDIGFLDEKRRMGVAIGRAQDELYIYGNSRTVTVHNQDTESREFFRRLKVLVEKYGEVVGLKKPEKGRRNRKGGRGSGVVWRRRQEQMRV